MSRFGYGSWAERIARVSVLLLLAIVTLQYIASGRNDPYRCRSLLTDGSWPPQDDLAADRRRFEKWEPSACRMHEYSRDQFRDCAAGRRVVFVGDSTTRQIFWAAAQRLDHKKAEVGYLDLFISANTQRDIAFEAEGVSLEFVWDPWLNSTRLFAQLEGFRGSPSRADGGMSEELGEDLPALMVLGAPGLFSARHGGDAYLNLFKHAIDGVRQYLDQPFNAGALTPREYRDLESQILLAPVPIPDGTKLTMERRATLTPQRLGRMNEYLRQLPSPANSRVIWSYNQMTANVGSVFDQNGMHVDEVLAERRIDVALNVRCNAGLAKHGLANQRTCCVAYPSLAKAQAILILAGTLVLPVLLWARRNSLRGLVPYLPTQSALVASLTLVGCALYCYFTDRTHALAQSEKHFDIFIFAALWAALFTLSVCTFRPTSNAVAITESWNELKPRREEFGFLSRPQSDEWKGLMQTGLLLMHFQQTSQVLSLYKITRLFAACYIFMSTYGHATYFLKTGDFGFRRVATVLFRLNFMGCLLSLMLKSDWTVYFFPRLVSFWFLVTFITFRVFAKVNDNPALVLAKISASLVAANVFLLVPGILEACGTVFRDIGQISFDAGDVRGQLSVDRLVPFFGMLAAGIAHRISILKANPNRARGPSNPLDRGLSAIIFSNRLAAPLKLILVASSCVYFLLFFYHTQLTRRYPDIASYNNINPYISCIAVLSYAVVRNHHITLRSMHMLLPVPLGKMALELYLLQNHIWLAGDGTGILRTGPSPRSGWPGLFGWGFETVLLTVTFLCLSWMAHEATGRLAAFLFGDPARRATAGMAGEYGDYELGLDADKGALPRPASVVDIQPGTGHVDGRGTTWTSGPRTRAGLLGLLMWVGNILNK